MSTILFYLFYAFAWLFSLLPLGVQYLLSDFLFFILYYLSGYRKKVVFNNLKNSFPDKDDKELKRIMKKFYKHLADLFIENIALIHLSEKEILKRVKFKNPELLDEFYENNKSVAIVVGHYANWEWLASVALLTKLKVIAIVKPLSNKRFNEFMNSLRHKFGMHTVAMNKIVREIIAAEKDKQAIATFFAADQSPMKAEIKYWADFLNQKTAVYLGLEKIVKKHKHALVFFKMEKIKRGYYEVDIVKLFDGVSNVSEHEITERHLKVLEEIIINKPEYWLWSHKRWKHKPA